MRFKTNFKGWGDMRLSLKVGKKFRVNYEFLIQNSLQVSNVAEIERFLPL